MNQMTPLFQSLLIGIEMLHVISFPTASMYTSSIPKQQVQPTSSFFPKHATMAQELYSVPITLKDGRWMKLIRQCRDGKSEHYWSLDIINIPPDSATCTVQKTPWLNLSIMRKNQNTSTSYLFQNLLYQNFPNVFLHDLPLFVFTLCLTTQNSLNLNIVSFLIKTR